MSSFIAATDAEIARARSDPAFRQRLLAQNLESLITALNRLRQAESKTPEQTGQIRQGVQFAVRLADILQKHAERYNSQGA
jgi:hypothetical protein